MTEIYGFFDNLQASPTDLERIVQPAFPHILCNPYCIKTDKWELNIGSGKGSWVLIHVDGEPVDVLKEMKQLTKLIAPYYPIKVSIEINDSNDTIVESFYFGNE